MLILGGKAGEAVKELVGMMEEAVRDAKVLSKENANISKVLEEYKAEETLQNLQKAVELGDEQLWMQTFPIAHQFMGEYGCICLENIFS